MQKKLVLVAALAALVGCVQDTPSGPTAEFVNVEPKLTTGGFEAVYTAGDTVTIVAFNTSSGESVPGIVISSAGSAAQHWND